MLQGVAGTGIWTLGLALAVDSIPKERFGIVMGYIMIGFSLGQLIGPPVDTSFHPLLHFLANPVFDSHVECSTSA